MMNIREAREILATINVTAEQIEKSAKYLSDKIEQSKKSGAYRQQGGTMFKFSDGAVAWVSLWKMNSELVLHLTERGEDIYIGTNVDKCAEMLYKLGVAHKTYGKKFLGCA